MATVKEILRLKRHEQNIGKSTQMPEYADDNSDRIRRVRPKISAEEKKKRLAIAGKKYRKKRITFTKRVMDRWNILMLSLNINKHSELATLLIDNWYMYAGITGTVDDHQMQHNGESTEDSKEDLLPLTIYENFSCGNTSGVDLGGDGSFQSEAMLHPQAVKIEVEDIDSSEETDTCTDYSTDEEIKAAMKFLKNKDKIVKLAESQEDEQLANGRRSRRVQKRGYRQDYAALDWEEAGDLSYEENSDSKKMKHAQKTDRETSCDEVVDEWKEDGNDEGDVVKSEHDNDESLTAEDIAIKLEKVFGTGPDPNFSLSEEESDGYEDSEYDMSTDEAEPDVCSDHNEAIVEIVEPKKVKRAAPKERKKRTSEKKPVEKVKKVKTAYANKEAKVRKAKIKKPWIKIHLSDHEDKYKIEIVESYERKNRKSDASEELYSCLVCQHFKCASHEIFEDHIEKHVNKALECEMCHYTAYCKTDIRRHKQSCGQLSKGRFVCAICGVFLSAYDSKKLHMGKVHNIAEWKCRFCPDLFISQAERLFHMRELHSDLCQYCEICKKSKYSLSKEEFVSHKENCSTKQQCQVCGLLVGCTSMHKHMLDKHQNVRRFQCHMCPYAAKSRKRLNSHLLTHTSVHPYSCDQCPFTCIQPYQLTSHMRTHTGEKPYKCTQCKYAAAWNVQLKDHVKVHSMGTAVPCQQCDILFKNEKTLNLHEKKEHAR